LLIALFEQGPIFRLRLGAKTPIFVTSNALINEVCDEKRFKKTLKSVLGVGLTFSPIKAL
jgi:hypothetical protein